MAILFKFCKIKNSIRFLGRNEESKAAEYPLTPRGTHISNSQQPVRQFITEIEEQERKESMPPGVNKQIYWFIFSNENSRNSSIFFNLSKRLSEDLPTTLADIAADKVPGVSLNRMSL